MSYCYDVMSRVFAQEIAPKLEAGLALHFEMLIEAMHSANHRVPSADGVFKGDGINKSREVSEAARELDDYISHRPPER